MNRGFIPDDQQNYSRTSSLFSPREKACKEWTYPTSMLLPGNREDWRRLPLQLCQSLLGDRICRGYSQDVFPLPPGLQQIMKFQAGQGQSVAGFQVFGAPVDHCGEKVTRLLEFALLFKRAAVEAIERGGVSPALRRIVGHAATIDEDAVLQRQQGEGGAPVPTEVVARNSSFVPSY